MKRTVLAGLMVAGILALLSAPALAQKDPFEPAVGGQSGSSDPDSSDEGGPLSPPDDDEVSGAQDDDGTDVDPAPDTDPDPAPGPNETLPNTGVEVSGWLVIGYGLIAVGAAALLIGTAFSPSPRRA